MDSIQRLLCITFMTSQNHLWRNCCIMMSRGPWLLKKYFKRGFDDTRKQPIYEFNWMIISVEIQLIKPANQMTKFTLSVCEQFQTKETLFRSNRARLTDGGTSSSVVVAGYQFCLTNMADRKPNPCIVKWILFTWYLNSPPFGRAAIFINM